MTWLCMSLICLLRMDGGVFVGGKKEVASGVDGVGLGENDMGDRGILGVVHEGRVSGIEIGVSKFEL